MSKGTRKSNGEGTVYFVEKEGCWRAEIIGVQFSKHKTVQKPKVEYAPFR